MKKILGTLVVGAAICAMAGFAHASCDSAAHPGQSSTGDANCLDVNIYGASAQYLLWNAVAPAFLHAQYGCTITGGQSFQDGTAKNGITEGTVCSGVSGGYTSIQIRYSSKASYDGVNALVNRDPTGVACNPGTGLDNHFRTMKAYPDASGTLDCVRIHGGASDVSPDTFLEDSTGADLGPNGNGTAGWQVRTAATLAVDPGSLNHYNPVVVPFGFFVNKAVTFAQCTGPAGSAKVTLGWGCGAASDCNPPDGVCNPVTSKCTAPAGNAGNACSVNSDCNTNSGVCGTPATITNITRLQAVLLFSGVVTNWNQFGPGYPNLNVWACLRHAGSGTHATFDHAVMDGQDAPLGGGLQTPQLRDGLPYTAVADQPPYNFAGLAPAAHAYLWYNDGSADEVNCINGNVQGDAAPAGHLLGGIGYCDADQATGASGTSQNVVQITYNGKMPTSENIQNHSYDFFTNEWLFDDTTTNPAQDPIINDLSNYAGAAGGVNLPTAKAIYWSAQQDFTSFNKTSDLVYPGN